MASLVTESSTLHLPEPCGLQPIWLNGRGSRKVLRVGRRGSKTRFAFFAALMGHGPGWEDEAPKFKGVLQGKDVVWFAQTYGNLSTVLWNEEIVPRMGHLPYVKLNAADHDVIIPGLAKLMLRSADRSAIDSVRGIGSRLGGVIIDEAAHLDLRGALLDVILPALLDNDGWLILMSTTNAGSDGGYDDQGAPQMPSYFNVLCEEIRAGTRGGEWEEYIGTAYDNPVMDPVSINALVAEYPPDSPKLKQEVYAELLKAGVGLALPNISSKTHFVDRFTPEPHWHQFGAFDWGYAHPWVFGWYCVDGDGGVYCIDTLHGRGDEPKVIGQRVIDAGVPVGKVGFVVHAGHDIWSDKGRAIGFKGPTIEETLRGYGWNLIRATIDRVNGLSNLRSYTYIDPVTGRGPKFVWMDTPGNVLSVAGCQRMQLDPKNMEDALGIDADSAGRGGDDDYDCLRYGLLSRPFTIPPAKPIVGLTMMEKEWAEVARLSAPSQDSAKYGGRALRQG